MEMGEDQVGNFVERQTSSFQSNGGIAHAVNQQDFSTGDERQMSVFVICVRDSS
jgi:hypothetical protein